MAIHATRYTILRCTARARAMVLRHPPQGQQPWKLHRTFGYTIRSGQKHGDDGPIPIPPSSSLIMAASSGSKIPTGSDVQRHPPTSSPLRQPAASDNPDLANPSPDLADDDDRTIFFLGSEQRGQAATPLISTGNSSSSSILSST
ncbi:hypothetical protein ACLOJK_014840 [Asimina triloba]